MSESAAIDVVKHEVAGRVLTGVGVSPDDLQKTMERFHPSTETETAAPDAVPATPEGQPATDHGAAPAPETEKKTRGQKRFDELTAQAKAAERERDEFKAQLEALKKTPPAAAPPAPTSSAAAAASPSPTKPELPALPQYPAHLQTFDAFAGAFPALSYDDFQTARVLHLQQTSQSDLDAKIRQRIEADQASRSFQSRIDEIYGKGREVFPDFDAVRQSPGGQVRFTQDKVNYILQQPAAHHLIYVISKDEALGTELAQADPMTFAVRLKELTPPSSVAAPASTGRVGAVTPPPPYQPVGSGSKTTVTPSAALAQGHDFDKSGYREKRAAERGVRRK